MAKTAVKTRAAKTAKRPATKKLLVADLALGRSGDKGDVSNVGLLALDEAKYNLLVKTVTPQSLRKYFGDWVQGEISVYPMPNIHALEIVLRKGLGGGATRTLRIDQTGKAMCEIVRRMEVEVPEAEAKKAGL